MKNTFAAELAKYGPQGGVERVTIEQARNYCRRLAASHYENFTVASWLLPRHLRQHFCNVYAYCRWADDLADELENPALSLELLDWWQHQLAACYQGQAGHPVFVALSETIEHFDIPQQPLLDLLIAFRQDQLKTRYKTFEQLLAYCRHSANPVGRLVLYLGRCYGPETAELSDSICTGLQLANFWQDVARDYQRGRIYLPQEDCQRFGYTQAMFERHQANEPFRRLLAWQVERAESFLIAGQGLPGLVSRDLHIDVRLFLGGGLAILREIRKIDYDVWRQRPTVSKLAKLGLLATAWWGSA